MGVIKGVDEGQAFALADIIGFGLGFVEVQAAQHDLCAMAAGLLDLAEGRGAGHHDRGGDAEATGMIGHALGMVAGGSGDDACLALGFRQVGETVQGAALLEGGGELEVLELHPDFGPGNR